MAARSGRGITTTSWSLSRRKGATGWACGELFRRERSRRQVMTWRCTLPGCRRRGRCHVAPLVSHGRESARCSTQRSGVSPRSDTAMQRRRVYRHHRRCGLRRRDDSDDEYGWSGWHDDALQNDRDLPGSPIGPANVTARKLYRYSAATGWRLADDDREQHRDDLHRHDGE